VKTFFKLTGAFLLFFLAVIFLFLTVGSGYKSLPFINTNTFTATYNIAGRLEPLVNSISDRTSKEDRFNKIIVHIDELVQGSDAYKNYLRASIFNETVNLNITDDKLVEYTLLVIRNKANVGLAQVGPSGADKGFIDRWLEKTGTSEYDLLNEDELNVKVKDAFVVDRQIFEVKENYEYIKVNFGIECATNPRYCDAIWTDKAAVRQITQDPGMGDSRDHQTRIWNLNCNQAGSVENDFKEHELLEYNIVSARNVCPKEQVELSYEEVMEKLNTFKSFDSRSLYTK
jgi:hypothetical protein